MRSLYINGFKTDAPYNAVHCRLTLCKGLIGYFAEGPQEKFYRIFTAMMNIVAYAIVRVFIKIFHVVAFICKNY